MGNTACEPAAKLQKSSDGDVTAAPLPQAAMPGVTPDPPEANTAPAEDKASEVNTASTILGSARTPMEGGKKRKVALYISYIGAGYHVSSVPSLHGRQRLRSVASIHTLHTNKHRQLCISTVSCMTKRVSPVELCRACSATQATLV